MARSRQTVAAAGDRKRQRTSGPCPDDDNEGGLVGEGGGGKKKKGTTNRQPALPLSDEHATLLADFEQLDAVCCLLLKRKLRCVLHLIGKMTSVSRAVSLPPPPPHLPRHPTDVAALLMLLLAVLKSSHCRSRSLR
jgi:hypothetical protein